MESKKSSLLMSAWTRKLFGAKMNYRLRYFNQRGHFPNLANPQDMSEILISQMFNPGVCAKYAPYIDKLAVRDYLKWKGFGDLLLEHYGVWSQPEDIEFEALPNKFVLKSNNGCGHHVICRDKANLDKKEAIKVLHKAILSGVTSIEPHYHHITPRVYAEELIDCGDGQLPIDYKFACIGGEVKDIMVCVDRGTNAKYCFRDTEWNPLPYEKEGWLPQTPPTRPRHLDMLVDAAKHISKDFGFVRVDLYEYRERPYLSELTFFPWGSMLYPYKNEIVKEYGECYRAWEKQTR